MKACDKYPPATPDDVARVEANCHQGKVHPLYWVVLVVSIIIGVGVYSDIVGFYEFEEIEEIVEGEDEDHDDETPEELDEDNWGSALPADERGIGRKSEAGAEAENDERELDDDLEILLDEDEVIVTPEEVLEEQILDEQAGE